MIIGITGTFAAGKGTVSEFLIQKGFQHYSVSHFLTQEIEKRGLAVNRDNMVLVANELREKNSPSYIVEKIYEMALKSGGDCVIESLRTPGEVNALKQKQTFYLIAIDADSKRRYDRAIKRGSVKDNVSYEDFLINEKNEMTSSDPNKQNLKKCMEMADYVIVNNGGIEELREKVEEIMKKVFIPKTGKRKDYISWDEYFMGIALLSAKRSKDPNTQTGACIIDEDKKIVGLGYNGFPIGCNDDNFPWSRQGSYLETKYPYVCHAELNAIINSPSNNLKDCTMYASLFPCNECAKVIIQSGIKKIIYLSDKYSNSDSTIAAKNMFHAAGVGYEKMNFSGKEIVLKFEGD